MNRTAPDMDEGGRQRLVSVLGPDGEDWGLMTVPEVVDLSHSLDLDLIEVDGAGDPPVWRVGDYGRMKYEECVDAPRVVSEADSISRDAARRRRRKF